MTSRASLGEGREPPSRREGDSGRAWRNRRVIFVTPRGDHWLPGLEEQRLAQVVFCCTGALDGSSADDALVVSKTGADCPLRATCRNCNIEHPYLSIST
eukprot:s781_g19.t1